MPITHDELIETIKLGLPEAEITARDLAGDSDHWEVSIKAAAFAGKSRIEQHRIVQNTLKDKNIHALSIKTSA